MDHRTLWIDLNEAFGLALYNIIRFGKVWKNRFLKVEIAMSF